MHAGYHGRAGRDARRGGGDGRVDEFRVRQRLRDGPDTGQSAADAILWGNVQTNDGRQYQDDLRISVPGGEATTYSLEFDVASDGPLSDGEFDYDAWIE